MDTMLMTCLNGVSNVIVNVIHVVSQDLTVTPATQVLFIMKWKETVSNSQLNSHSE